LDFLHGSLQLGYLVSNLLLASSEFIPQIAGHLLLAGGELCLVPGQLFEALSQAARSRAMASSCCTS